MQRKEGDQVWELDLGSNSGSTTYREPLGFCQLMYLLCDVGSFSVKKNILMYLCRVCRRNVSVGYLAYNMQCRVANAYLSWAITIEQAEHYTLTNMQI